MHAYNLRSGSVKSFMITYFGLGSNLGNRLQNLRDAMANLQSLGKIIDTSDVFATPAWGGVAQPDYLNACVKIECNENLTPTEILRRVKNFETELGRVKSIRWGPRKIDIDILLIDEIIYKSPELIIPHMNLHERLFVLVPLSQVIPENWRYHENHKTVQEMIHSLAHEIYPLRITRLK